MVTYHSSWTLNDKVYSRKRNSSGLKIKVLKLKTLEISSFLILSEVGFKAANLRRDRQRSVLFLAASYRKCQGLFLVPKF